MGGAVRDQLLGLNVIDRDWVIVGGNPEQLIKEGYEQVGKDFPVFLHPHSKEEYALARIERKVGIGHTGFECDAGEHVSLEDDLLRRDLTINAMAKSSGGELVDPYGGLNDLKLGLLRHVSDAFGEDPLRVLRVARFYAKLSGFTVHAETLALMKDMVEDSLLEELPSERVWTEVSKALETDHPHRFFELLESIGAHRRLWPSISVTSLSLLGSLEGSLLDAPSRFSILCFNADEALKQNLTKLKVPNKYADLAIATAEHVDQLMGAHDSPESIVNVLYTTDAFRKNDRFVLLNRIASEIASVLGKSVRTDWLELLAIADQIDSQQVDQSLKGVAFGDALKGLRKKAIQNYLSSRSNAR